MTEIRSDLKLHLGEINLNEGAFDDEYVQDYMGAWVWDGGSVDYLVTEDREELIDDGSGLPPEVQADLRKHMAESMRRGFAAPAPQAKAPKVTAPKAAGRRR